MVAASAGAEDEDADEPESLDEEPESAVTGAPTPIAGVSESEPDEEDDEDGAEELLLEALESDEPEGSSSSAGWSERL